MLTEQRTEEAKAVRRKALASGRDYSPRRGKVLVPRKDYLVQALTTGLTKDHTVLVIPKSTNSQYRSMKNTSRGSRIMETSQKSTLRSFRTSTVSSVAFLVRHFLSPEAGKDSLTRGEHSSLTLREYCKQNDLDFSSLKMSRDSSVMTVGVLSEQLSPRLMNCRPRPW